MTEDNASFSLRNLGLRRAARQLTFRRAALIAVSSIEQSMMTTTSVKDCVALHIQLLHLQTASIEAETAFSDSLAVMDLFSKKYIVFKLVDRDSNGKISLSELAMAFQKMDPTKPYASHVQDAHKSICKADRDLDGMLSQSEFENSFLPELFDALKCSPDEGCDLLIQYLAFNETGHDIIQEALETNTVQSEEDRLPTEKEIEEEVIQIRIAVLFQNLDFNGTGRIRLLDVLERLVEVLRVIDEKTRNLLLMVDDSSPEMDFFQFSSLILNLTSMVPPTIFHFHRIADTITSASTRSSIQRTREAKQVMDAITVTENTLRVTKDLKEEGVDQLTFQRIIELFRLIDKNEFGYIRAEDMATPARSLKGLTGKVDDAIEETLTLFAGVNEVKDPRRNIHDLATFVTSLSHALETDIDELISFMGVELFLRDKPDRAAAYVDKMRGRLARTSQALVTSERSRSFLETLS